MNRIRTFLLPILIFAGLTMLFLYPLFYPKIALFANTDYGLSEVFHGGYPSRFLYQQELLQGRLPLWNSKVALGFPEFAKAEVGSLYLPSIIAYSQLSFPVAVNVLYAFAMFIGSIGMYAYLRFRSLGVLPSLFGGIAFGFSGYFLVHFTHISRFQTASMIPFIMLAFEYLLRKPSGIAVGVLALLLSQQFYAGHFQVVFMTGIILTGIFLYYAVRRKLTLRNILYMSLTLGLYMALIAVQLLPTMELLNSTQRGQGLNPEEALSFSFPWHMVWTYIDPFAFGSPHNGKWPDIGRNGGNIFWENIGFIGISGIMLSLIGLIAQYRKKTYVKMLGIGALVTVLFMMGKYSPLYFVHSMLPFSFFRAPSKYILILTVIFAVLLAYGVQWIQKKSDKKKNALVFPVLSAVLILMIYELFSFHRTYNTWDSPDSWLSDPPVMEYVKDDTTAEYRHTTRGSGVLWNAVLLDNGWQSLDEYKYLRNALLPDINMLYNTQAFNIYQILMTNRHRLAYTLMTSLERQSVENDAADPVVSTYLDMMNIRYVITQYDGPYGTVIAELPPPQKYIDRELPPLKVYKRESALPRYRLAFDYVSAQTSRDIIDILTDDTFSPRDTVILEKNISAELSGDDDSASVQAVNIQEQELEFKTEADQQALFVLADSFYPGWKAYIDGDETEILAANINQRAILLPAGSHTIRFAYRPESFMLGRNVSLAGYTFTILLIAGSLLSVRTQASRSTQQPSRRS